MSTNPHNTALAPDGSKGGTIPPFEVIPETPASIVQIARVAAGLTQGDLARDIGCSRSTIQAVEETGTNKKMVAMALAVRLGLPPTDAVYGAIMEGRRFGKWRLTLELIEEED